MAFMPAAPRSTTTKQLDCWTIRRSRLEVGGRWYWPVRMVYQPADWFSTSETVPRGEAQRSSALLALAAPAPAALPVATVLASALPIFRSVVSQPARARAARMAAVLSAVRLIVNTGKSSRFEIVGMGTGLPGAAGREKRAPMISAWVCGR